MIVKEFAQALNKVPGKVVDELRRQYPEQKWTVDSQVPEEILARFRDITNSERLQPQQSPIADIPEATITKADEAIQQASYKLTAADKETISGAIAVQNEQSKILGASTGVTGALLFMESLIGAYWINRQWGVYSPGITCWCRIDFSGTGIKVRVMDGSVSRSCFTALFHETFQRFHQCFRA